MEFEDDVVDDTAEAESDIDLKQKVEDEIKHYVKLTMNKEQKKKDLNILAWWRYNKQMYPCLFKAAQACLHVRATSVPAERIFSLAGYVVRYHRTKLLSDNVNKLIFLHQNGHLIPDETPPVIQLD